MLRFFYFENTLRLIHEEGEHRYEHLFEAMPDVKRLSLDHVYFSTYSNFLTHMRTISKDLGQRAGKIYALDPNKLKTFVKLPVSIGFGCLEENLKVFQGRSDFKLAIFNAMSKATGDHLIGMQAFNYFQDQLRRTLGDTRVEIDFYQSNPFNVAPITRQWRSKFDKVMALPNTVSQLREYDAFIDLGDLLMRDSFGIQPMIDFFYEAFSLDASTIPLENKRMKYGLSNDLKDRMACKMREVSGGKPVLLFHHTATTPIREMPDVHARRIISDIIDKSVFHVVTARPLEFQHERFTDISSESKTLDDFAAIIANAHALVSVDTVAYHLADAFSVPSVVIFTSINPDLRIRYYPYAQSIMLEEESGMLYGLHKASEDKAVYQDQIAYVESLWSKLTADEILTKLMTKKGEK